MRATITLFFAALTFLLDIGDLMAAPATAPWWQNAVVYQIYPRSYQDSNGDGIGDLHGITQRLGYLQAIGIDAVWISPFYPSPMKDFGYDISNYTDVDPRFGTLADFDLLTSEAHRRRIKVLLDFVPNHTSDQHPWFQESRSSIGSAKRDWYIWRHGRAPGGAPNNWRSIFGGSAWELDPQTSQYYYHAFLKEQPDLNWTNPEVRAAMLSAMRFWLDRGVDGFRVDAVTQIMEDPMMRDEPVNPNFNSSKDWDHDRLLHPYTDALPTTHGVIRDMRKLLASYPGDRLLINESYLPFDKLVAYYGTDNEPEAHLPFNFHLIGAAWTPAAIAKLIRDYEAALPKGAWPNWVMGNHDNHRISTRISKEQSRIAAMLLLTLRGTPTLYYGDELGLSDSDIPSNLVQDPVERKDPGKGFGRDPERAPMLWDNTMNAGFTAGKPWLPLDRDFGKLNVAAQQSDRQSILSLYQLLLRLRRLTPALTAGDIQLFEAPAEVLAYTRQTPRSRMLVVLNFSDKAVAVPLGKKVGRIAMTTMLDHVGQKMGKNIDLRPHEGVVAYLD